MKGELTIHVCNADPPVPCVQPWYAYVDGEEEWQEYGWGGSPAEALRALAEVLEERQQV
jgi:hypothetical protein